MLIQNDDTLDDLLEPLNGKQSCPALDRFISDIFHFFLYGDIERSTSETLH